MAVMSPMPQAERTRLARFITYLRRDWHLAGVDKAIVQLELDIHDTGRVAAIAIAAARDPRNRLPIVMTQDGPHRSSVVATTTHPTSADIMCKTHGNTVKLPDGRWLCCAQEAAEREQVADAIGVQPDWWKPATPEPTTGPDTPDDA